MLVMRLFMEVTEGRQDNSKDDLANITNHQLGRLGNGGIPVNTGKPRVLRVLTKQ